LSCLPLPPLEVFRLFIGGLFFSVTPHNSFLFFLMPAELSFSKEFFLSPQAFYGTGFFFRPSWLTFPRAIPHLAPPQNISPQFNLTLRKEGPPWVGATGFQHNLFSKAFFCFLCRLDFSPWQLGVSLNFAKGLRCDVFFFFLPCGSGTFFFSPL